MARSPRSRSVCSAFVLLAAFCLLAGCRAHLACEGGGGNCPSDLEPDVAARGTADAPIVIEEFGEFQCPYCGRVQDTLHALDEAYPEKIRWVFRHYPLPFHEHAEVSSRAAVAALRQGRFWPFHDLLFGNPRRLSPDDLTAHAQRLGLDMARFRADMEDTGVMAVVRRDMQRGSDLAVRGVPHFFINGRRLAGAQPLDAFRRVIDEELEKAQQLLADGVAPGDVARELTRRNRAASGE